jgi:hypothetical protein
LLGLIHELLRSIAGGGLGIIYARFINESDENGTKIIQLLRLVH